MGADLLAGKIGIKGVSDGVSAALMLVSGNAMTQVKLGKEIGSHVEVGASSYYSLNPNHWEAGLTTPKPFVNVNAGNQKYHVDPDTMWAQFTKDTVQATVGYDRPNHELSYNLGVLKPLGSGVILSASIGRGSSVGNLDMASALVNPTNDPFKRDKNYATLGMSYSWGHKSSSRKVASSPAETAAPESPPAQPALASGATGEPQATAAAAPFGPSRPALGLREPSFAPDETSGCPSQAQPLNKPAMAATPPAPAGQGSSEGSGDAGTKAE
jgi:hypothetical protein